MAHSSPDPLADIEAYIEHYQLEDFIASALKEVVNSRTRTPILGIIDSLTKKVNAAAATHIQALVRGRAARHGDRAVVQLATHHAKVHRLDSIHRLDVESSSCVKVLVCMDPGQDLDDEMFLILLSALTARSLVECVGVVAVLQPAAVRAQLARSTLDLLGMHEVPVCAGSETEPVTLCDGSCNPLLEPVSLCVEACNPI